VDYSSFKRMIAPLVRRVYGSIIRGPVRLFDDTGTTGRQRLQVAGLAGELHNDIERLQPYGFYSHPPTGSEAFGIWIDGNRDNGVIFMVDDRSYRVQPLAEGEFAFASVDNQLAGGHRIHFKDGQEIEIHCKKLTATVTGDAEITATGDAEIVATGSAKIEAGTGTTVKAANNILVDAGGTVFIGGVGGAAAVARVGDPVQVLTYTGTITGGSSKVFSQ
jgi:phage baseplate assembly protein V